MTPRPRKQFGQHWLRSEKALQRILKAATLSPQDRVLEIGPGTGTLTRLLLPEVEWVVAVEIDRDLGPLLIQKLGRIENFLLLQADFLELDLERTLGDLRQKAPNKVVANIPYNITGPILEKLLGTLGSPRQPAFEVIVLLVQKEVADRLCAQPGSKAYGGLSVKIQYLANCELIAAVSAKAFFPPPKVDSAVVRLRPYTCTSQSFPQLSAQSSQLQAQDPGFLETLVKLGFATRRKMLRNNLKSVVDRDRLTQILEQWEIDPQVRAEALSVAQWVALSNQLSSDA